MKDPKEYHGLVAGRQRHEEAYEADPQVAENDRQASTLQIREKTGHIVSNGQARKGKGVLRDRNNGLGDRTKETTWVVRLQPLSYLSYVRSEACSVRSEPC